MTQGPAGARGNFFAIGCQLQTNAVHSLARRGRGAQDSGVIDQHPLLSIPLILLLLVMGAYLVYIPIRIARERNHPRREAITACAVLSLFIWPLWIVALIWALSAPDPKAGGSPQKPKGYAGGKSLNMPDDKPAAGRYVVRGVDRQTGMDTTWRCTAESEANAKVKGELQGIVVTSVERD